MPNRANTKELINECTWNWSTKNGISGYKVTGPNGNWIFIPAGYYWVGSGSTGEAALSMGRKFIGIEFEKDFYEMTSKRLEKY